MHRGSSACCNPFQRRLSATPAASAPAANQREAELTYLHRLRVGELIHTELYTPMAGVAQVAARGGAVPRMPTVVMRPEFEHLCRVAAHTAEARTEPRRYGDIVEAFGQVRRAVLLGEPGAGKTTTLWKPRTRCSRRRARDPNSPVPLLVSLGKWTEAQEPLRHFLERQLGELGPHLDRLLNTNRVVLLLDGLNEVPAGERTAKAVQIKSLLAENAKLSVMASCRELDYTVELVLDLDTVTIRPLDPPRILDFVTGYLTAAVEPNETDLARRELLGRERGKDLFWRLAGGTDVRELWKFPDIDLGRFWSEKELPEGVMHRLGWRSRSHRAAWRRAVDDPRSLIRLAGNPYLLFMRKTGCEPI